MYQYNINILIIIIIVIIIIKVICRDIVLGVTKEGIECYMNGGYNKGEENWMEDRIYLGIKWECVEFIRRYLIKTKGITFNRIKNAKDLINMDEFKKINKSKIKINHYKNGDEIINIGDIIIIEDKMNKNDEGHVCIVSAKNENKLEIIEQNYDNRSWNGRNYSRIFMIKNNIIYTNNKNENIIDIIRIYE